MYSLPVQRLREIASNVVPGAALGGIKEVKSTQLPRLYSLKMTDGRPLLLAITPRLSVRLLRHEATIMASEASLVYFLSQSSGRSESPRSPKGKTDTRPNNIQRIGLAPKLLKHSSNTKDTSYPYSIFEPTSGAPISTLNPQLSPVSRRAIDKEVGSLARALASQTSPSGTFGMVNRILPDPFSAHSSTTPKVSGSQTWSEAFKILLEATLRDGEDMYVLLPYETIRAQYERLCWRLDAVTSPRLVVINVNSDDNVMVERTIGKDASYKSTESFKLTGLRNWSQGVFGDPLISSCFDNPSEEFLEGWSAGGEEVIENEENMGGRLMLYQCYRAIVTIVTEYYRPQSDSSKRELDGRRKLTIALKELDKVLNDEVEDMKRVRSLSTELVSSKRQKLSED